jgi:hypothetical protein
MAAVDVASRATGGSGAPNDPWTGWELNTAWNPETEYAFRAGYYAYAASPNFLQTGIALKGEPGTVLQFAGGGNAVVFDNPGTTNIPYRNWTMNVRMENFVIQGNAGATNGIYARGMRNAVFRNITVRDVTAAAFRCEACVTNILDNFRVEGRSPVAPSHGIVLAARGPDTSTTTTVMNAAISGVTGAGVWVQPGSYGNTFMNGAVEGNPGKGMVFDGPLNTVMDMRFAANLGTDIEINHASNELHGVTSAGLVDVRKGQMNKLRGTFASVSISDICDFTDILGASIAVLRDDARDTVKAGTEPIIGVPFVSRAGRGP